MKRAAWDNFSEFVANRNAVKKEFKTASAYMQCLCALLLTLQRSKVDSETIAEIRHSLKKEFKIFSPLRGIAMPALITQLCVAKDDREMTGKVKEAYRLLREEGFLGTDFLPLPAYILARNNVDAVLSRKMRDIYLMMRSKHKAITGGDDTGFAALMAVYIDTVQTAEQLCEQAFSILSKRFGSKNETWLMSHILAFDGENIEKNAERTIELYERLKADKRMFKGTESPILALLGVLGCDAEKTALDIGELSDALKVSHGFSPWQIPKGQRQLYSAALIAMTEISEKENSRETRMLMYLLITAILVSVTMATIMAASSAATM
ncbi:MAG: DUF4003 family protein [Clostridia bacterium]|nr:DUF4003 family protein [Clostridia bacterium]